MSNVSEWDVSAANNTSAAPNGAPEGMAPSGVNDTIREMMAAVSRWYEDGNASLVTGGSSNTYTLTTNSSHSSLSDQSILVFRADRANSGAATLNVDGLGAKSIRANGEALDAGQIAEDVVYIAAYNRTDDAYDLIGAFNFDASNLTTGELPDARLSSNVPLKDAANTFEEIVTIENATLPALRLDDTNASTDEGLWSLEQVNGRLFLRTRDDSGSLGESLLDAQRSGTEITTLAFAADTITLNGVDVTDYARLSQNNVFLAGSGATDGLTISAASPRLHLFESDQAEDARNWSMTVANGQFRLRATDDDGLNSVEVMTGERTGSVNFPNGVLQYGGSEVAIDSEVVHNTGNETVGGVKTFSSRPQFSSAGGFLSHASSSNTGGVVTISSSLAGSAAAVGSAGDIRLVYS